MMIIHVYLISLDYANNYVNNVNYVQYFDNVNTDYVNKLHHNLIYKVTDLRQSKLIGDSVIWNDFLFLNTPY